MTDTENRTILSHPFFGELDAKNAARIFSDHGACVMQFSEGEVIHSPKTDEKKLGLILSGKAVASTKDPSKNTLLRMLGTGDLFGCANLFTEEAYVSVIRAAGDCRVFFLPESGVRALLESDRTFLYRYLAFLSGRVCYLNRKIGYLTAGPAERRLALYLSSFGIEQIRLPISLSALSELLDVGRASLYRAFDRLIADGYIQKDGRRITVNNATALQSAYHTPEIKNNI